ncbi:16S rRNA (cytidine(1402)-2'-O)-methyltransferase [Ruminococcaceae bacterium OttesenSCG-928-I18]|nr:16S rRNA (cytidine(1402)-2'-O)-methyltransferase [Ruminococcaceae bacterium OttesenSCG-928-I18]
MQGILYIVGTPIGNLQDMTPRAEAVLREADFIAAEDTRVTVKLLNHLGIKKEMVSYHKHNERERAERILARLESGEKCALCSDAGLPAISDPGEFLVKKAIEQNIAVVPLPGPNAALTALCASGQDTMRFVFEGFLPQNKNARRERLTALQKEERTMLFYEAPHKLHKTLLDLGEALGQERSLTVCRELTKMHEEIVKTTLGKAEERYREEKPRGEFVLVVAGAPAEHEAPRIELWQAAERALSLAAELPASEAARRAAAESGHPKSAVYREMQRRKKTEP